MQAIQQPQQQSTQTNFTILAVGLMIVTSMIHLFNANEALGDATYKGALFIANGLGAASSSLAYIASRTIGLPGLPAEPDAWFEPLGFASLLAEIAFVGVFIAWMRQTENPKLQS
jgi:hypothetical protein